MKIVPMEERHLDELAQLEQECFSHPWSRQALAEELHNPAAVFLVAVEGESVLGYAGMHVVCGEGYIDKYRCISPQPQKGRGSRTGAGSHRLDGTARRPVPHLGGSPLQRSCPFIVPLRRV